MCAFSHKNARKPAQTWHTLFLYILSVVLACGCFCSNFVQNVFRRELNSIDSMVVCVVWRTRWIYLKINVIPSAAIRIVVDA